MCPTVSTAAEMMKTLSKKERGGTGLAGVRGWATGRGEGLTALVVEVVHGPLGGVIKGAGFVHVGAGPGEQQRGGEMQGRGQCQCPGVGGSPASLSLLQAAGESQPRVSTT